jgi:DNA polymerase elongation subunit (family B)
LKISANSAYGSMGVRRGYLPFMPGAMCTTYKGRISIELAANSIQKDHQGVLVYGDTDSNYVSFPHLKTARECWDHAVKVALDVSKLFPKPMSLAFEEKVYWVFLLLTKKRYMSITCDKDGKADSKISKKGVLLQRRDNCAFVRNIYEKVTVMIFEKHNFDSVMYFILQEINKLCSKCYNIDDFVITKSIGEIGDLIPRSGEDKNGKQCYKIGDYKVKLLPTDDAEKEKKLKLKYTNDEKEYYLRCLPAQVQLGEKMRQRGQIVSVGSRLEYVLTTNGGHLAEQYIKIESSEYFKKSKNKSYCK